MNIVEYNILLDPFLIFQELSSDYSILLQSTIQNPKYGRYSFIFLNSKENFVLDEKGDVLNYLEDINNILKNRYNSSDFIFSGGLAGFLSYNFGVDLHGVKRKTSNSLVPKAYFGYFEDFIVFDHFSRKIFSHFKSKTLKNKFDKLISKIPPNYNPNFNFLFNSSPAKVEKFWSNFQKREYMEAIRKIKEYILEGDVYQVNLSQRFYINGTFDCDHLYYLLRKRNYGFYHAYIKLPKVRIISTSPELFLQRRKNKIITKPIKGTIRRGKDFKEDKFLKEKLFNDMKCRSELLMIVDLERNDFAKICLPNSIEVEKLFEVEEYSTVFHLVSTIKGILSPEVDFKRIIETTFPGGSITGAPKLAAIKIIEELEKDPRDLYCGSIGYISNNRNMDFNIAIRTIII
ncbi:MAG: anthranilate synthase component I family protein, partial [Dictyoglomus sp.]